MPGVTLPRPIARVALSVVVGIALLALGAMANTEVQR